MSIRSSLLSAALLCGGITTVVAQGQQDIELNSKWVGTSLEINATKRPLGSYTVLLVFSELQNTRQGRTFRTVMRNNSQKLLTIAPVNAEQPVDCAYRYSYVRGYHSPKLDSAFVYRLPYSTAREGAEAYELSNLNERYFEGKPRRGWKAWQFLLAEGDTVFAMRKGVVVEVNDGEAEAQKGMEATFRSKKNDVLVEQPDGTLCQYSVLENGSICVKVGETVYPGTPLGRAGAYYEGGERQVRTLVYFPEENKRYRENDRENSSMFEYVYYNPHFATPEGILQLNNRGRYRAVSSPELVQREMTKKEMKDLTTGGR